MIKILFWRQTLSYLCLLLENTILIIPWLIINTENLQVREAKTKPKNFSGSLHVVIH